MSNYDVNTPNPYYQWEIIEIIIELADWIVHCLSGNKKFSESIFLEGMAD
jgi:hypothetical protein